MKIAILSFYSGLVDRGVETWAKSVKEKLQGKVNVDIFGGESFDKEIDWQNKHQTYWRVLLLRHLLRIVSKLSNYDVIVPTNGTIQTLVCRVVSWFKGKPMVVFGHSGPGADDKWNLLCLPDIFVAFSIHQKKWAEQFKLPWTKVIRIPHAIDLTRFTPAYKKPGKKIVLCVAANAPDKRVSLVRNAVRLIPNTKFVAVGKGNPIEASFGEMPDIYRSADVFCFTPQPWEAFGLVFLEAMATNLPVVTTNDPIRREIVGEAGFFVDDPEDSKELSAAIGLALRTNWGDKPRKQAERFSWDKIAGKYEDLFRSLTK